MAGTKQVKGLTPVELSEMEATRSVVDAPSDADVKKEMDALDVLLGARAVKQEEEWVIYKRDGLPADLRITITSLTDREFKDISIEAEEAVRAINRRARRAGGEQATEINTDKFLRLIVAKGVINPSFSHPEVLRKHGVHTAEEVVQKLLLPGEVAKISELIMELSGFNEHSVEYAKAL